MNPSAAALLADNNNEQGALAVKLRWRVGDSWSSNEWAVLVNGAPVDLTAGGWQVRAQARGRAADEDVIAQWGTHVVGAGTVALGTATVVLDDDGTELVTSTVQIRHTPAVSRGWGSLVGEFDAEVIRRPIPDLDPNTPPVENYTIAVGTVHAVRDVSR